MMLERSNRANDSTAAPAASKPLHELPSPRRQSAAANPEQRVLRQLVEALLFEGLVEYIATTLVSSNERRYAPIFDSRIDFRVGSRRYTCVGTRGAFGRFRVAPGSIEHRVGLRLEEATFFDVASALPVPELARQRLIAELTQTAELARWNFEELPHQHEPRRAKSFRELESAIVEGHLYHPSFKSRTGFSLVDHQAYGPEVGAQFKLQWLAIAKPCVRAALPCDEATFWSNELGRGTYAQLTARLKSVGGGWAGYCLVPIHPWQLATLRDRLRSAAGRREILELGSAGDFYQASQSVRTLLNVSDPTKPNIKLPLDIVCTSTHRNLRPPFVCTAPTLSNWLQSLVERDPFLSAHHRITMLREYAAILYEPGPTGGDWQPQGQTLIGTVLRESVESKLQPGHSAIPFTALMLMEGDGRPFIADWLHVHGTEQWLDQLLAVMLIPIWHLLVHHGLAFESHAQNLILIHVGGWPQQIVLRDFHEDTEYVTDYLSRPELEPDFARVEPSFVAMPDDDGYRMASTEALRELFMDTVYVYNLAELSFVLAQHCDFEEARFWNLVRSHLRRYAQSGVTARSRIARLACDTSDIVVESLLKKKVMNGDVLDFFEHTAQNPLHEVTQEPMTCST